MMTREQFIDRFKVQVSHVMDPEQAEEWINMICNIEKYDNITDVADRLFVGSSDGVCIREWGFPHSFAVTDIP